MNKVSVGIATYIGIVLSILTMLPAYFTDLANQLPNVNPEVWVITSSVIGALTVLGRMAQAIALIVSGQPAPPLADPTAGEGDPK